MTLYVGDSVNLRRINRLQAETDKNREWYRNTAAAAAAVDAYSGQTPMPMLPSRDAVSRYAVISRRGHSRRRRHVTKSRKLEVSQVSLSILRSAPFRTHRTRLHSSPPPSGRRRAC